MTGTEQAIIDQLKHRKERDAEVAIASIEKLEAHLADLKESVGKWNAGEPARDPSPYGNAFGDACRDVAAFRASASAYGTVAVELDLPRA